MAKKKSNKKLVAVDLFAGAGGFSLAAIQAGFEIKFAIENDPFAIKTYKKNILKLDSGKNATILDEDILSYSPYEIKNKILKDTKCDIILGGPPCQGFSTHRILNSGVKDPRNDLVLSYFDFVRALQPRVFLMENVPGILWERHKDYLQKFYEEGKKAGYHVFDPITLDARDFGVPQRRKRVFVLGIRGWAGAPLFEWPPQPTHAALGMKDPEKKVWVPCADVFEPAKDTDENDIHMKHGSTLVEAFRNTPPNGGSRKDSGRMLPCHEKHDGHKDVYGRIDPTAPAPTMTTACINPSKGRFVHPTEHHGITLRQAARIQTFPDDFIFEGGLIACGRQIGNAVPVELGKKLLEHIKNFLVDGGGGLAGSDLDFNNKIKALEN
ncbi:DNA cytosine methyltransferase [Acetobacter malorum]|uniref:DNA cytosine methyltransferase n=1 Tax=Acetobacter malorum TaxID=178901 RepID=UPI00248EDA8D|nr:DNA cytosine methyltransferase [Acetobacter malorum]